MQYQGFSSVKIIILSLTKRGLVALTVTAAFAHRDPIATLFLPQTATCPSA